MESINFNENLEALEMGKNPGLGIRKLHEMGINGSGVHIAVIDQNLDVDNFEYKENLESFKSFDGADDENVDLHGPAVASLLCGKNVGVAPGSRLHYFAIKSGGLSNSTKGVIDSIKDILIYNEKANENEKIKIINHCASRKEEFNPFIKQAKENGIIFVDSDSSLNEFGIFTGGSNTDKEDPDSYEFTKPKTFAEQMIIDKYQNNIIVPGDFRTYASSVNGNNDYRYDEIGGFSWAMPYLSGVFTLALGINPKLTEKDLNNFLHETAKQNSKGYKVIDPVAIVDLARKSLEI